MTSVVDIFIIGGNSLVELIDGQLVKSDIQLPSSLEYLSMSMDCKINAYCHVADTYLIYELADRQFILRHTFSKFAMDIPGHLININKCLYVKNILIIWKSVDGLNLFEIIDLESDNNTILICYGSYPVYCDGVLTIPPSTKHSKKYYNINLADKSITHECPYFMKNIQQIKETNVLIRDVGASNGFTIIKHMGIYYTVTGTLLCTGKIDINTYYYNNHIVTNSKLLIEHGAPVIEYTYNSDNGVIYIYAIMSGGHFTKPAIQASEYHN